MIPWDFGLINALKEKLNVEIFPSDPPDESRQTPYLILELKNIRQGVGRSTRAELQLKIVDEEKPSSLTYDFIKTIRKAITQKLTLKQGTFEIGEANIKLEKIVTGRSDAVLNMTALLNLKTIYHDEGDENGRNT